jgi:hypothetical protein
MQNTNNRGKVILPLLSLILFGGIFAFAAQYAMTYIMAATKTQPLTEEEKKEKALAEWHALVASIDANEEAMQQFAKQDPSLYYSWVKSETPLNELIAKARAYTQKRKQGKLKFIKNHPQVHQQYRQAADWWMAGDLAKAEAALIELAEQGYIDAQSDLYNLYRLVSTEEYRDNDKALYWLTQAAEAGYADSQYYLGLIYRNDVLGPPNWASMFDWIFIAANQGHLQAQDELGYVYHRGEGVKLNYVESYKWYEIAIRGYDKPSEEEAKAPLNPVRLAKSLRQRFVDDYKMPPSIIQQAIDLADAWQANHPDIYQNEVEIKAERLIPIGFIAKSYSKNNEQN